MLLYLLLLVLSFLLALFREFFFDLINFYHFLCKISVQLDFLQYYLELNSANDGNKKFIHNFKRRELIKIWHSKVNAIMYQ